MASSESFYRAAQKIYGSSAKRGLDLVVAGSGVVLLAPLMLCIALAVAADSKGPIIFRQRRYGAYRQPFTILKFRTMTVAESTGAFTQASRDDVRVTRVGRVLRRLSLDELPQLFNVLLGDMSVVGPRPHAMPMDDEFAFRIDVYFDRHLVRPGLTGLAQIAGYRGPTTSYRSLYSRLRCDRQYIKNWSIWSDIKIIFATPMTLLGKNAF